jgi:hypothetical protein
MKFCPMCKDCGYRGPVIVEDGVIADELREEYEKKKKEERLK